MFLHDGMHKTSLADSELSASGFSFSHCTYCIVLMLTFVGFLVRNVELWKYASVVKEP